MSDPPDWRKWFMHWLDRLMDPAIMLSRAERIWIVNSRKWIMEKEIRSPALWARDKVRRIARREGLMQYSAQRQSQKARSGSARRPAADWQHRPGAPMPVPPHRRRSTI